MTSRSVARLELMAAAILFSTGAAAIKAVTFSAVQIAGLRSGIAALALLLCLPAARHGWTWRAILVGLAYAATMVLYVTANRLTTAASTIFLQSTAPLYLLILGPWLLKEPIRRQDLAFMVAVALGLATLFLGVDLPAATAPDPALGNLLAALSGVTWALTVCGLRWISSGNAASSSAMAAVVAGNLIAFAACLPWVFPVGGHGAADWTLLIYLGAFQVGLAYLFVTAGLRKVPAFEASIILLLEPALNPVWAWLVHGEVPGVWTVAGGAVILGATVVKTWLDTRPRLPAPSEA